MTLSELRAEIAFTKKQAMYHHPESEQAKKYWERHYKAIREYNEATRALTKSKA